MFASCDICSHWRWLAVSLENMWPDYILKPFKAWRFIMISEQEHDLKIYIACFTKTRQKQLRNRRTVKSSPRCFEQPTWVSWLLFRFRFFLFTALCMSLIDIYKLQFLSANNFLHSSLSHIFQKHLNSHFDLWFRSVVLNFFWASAPPSIIEVPYRPPSNKMWANCLSWILMLIIFCVISLKNHVTECQITYLMVRNLTLKL